MSKRWLVLVVLLWQLVVYILAVSGAVAEIFDLLKVPLTDAGWQSVVGTMVAGVALELPILPLFLRWWFSHRRPRGPTDTR